MSLWKRKTDWNFVSEELTETTGYLKNPGCGWYHIHSFALDVPIDLEELYWCICKEETLSLLLFDIGGYREQPLPKEALSRMSEVLDLFQKQGKELILRVVYDREGKGMEREPNSIQRVEEHMRQIGAAVRQYEEQIIVFQGLFVGNWGEMHGSKFLSEDKLKRLALVLRESLGERICMAVRTPSQWRKLYGKEFLQTNHRLSLFDDGMFGSESNLGTYGQKEQAANTWQEPWCREDELEFVSRIGENFPYGGEAVGTDACGNMRAAVEAMKKTHVSYLNSVYDEQCLQRWKRSCWEEADAWQGMNGYDYIGCHLGYRFVIRKIELQSKKEGCLKVQIENIGFASLREEARLLALFENTNGNREMTAFSVKPGEWKSGEAVKISIPIPELPKDCETMQYRIYLQMQRKGDGRRIYFGNSQTEAGVYLGMLSHGSSPNRDKLFCHG